MTCLFLLSKLVFWTDSAKHLVHIIIIIFIFFKKKRRIRYLLNLTGKIIQISWACSVTIFVFCFFF